MTYDGISTPLHDHILQLEAEGLVTRTFRRLDPDRQQAILNAILDEAVARGPASVNIKQVAARAGAAVGSLYQYFGSRDTMLHFAVTLSARAISSVIAQSAPYLVDLPLREGLYHYIAGGVEWSRTEISMLRFFARAAYQAEPDLLALLVTPVAESMLALIRALLEAAIARGEVRPEIDLDATSRLLHALTIVTGDSQLLPGLNAYFQITGEEVTPEASLHALLDLVLNGIRADV